MQKGFIKASPYEKVCSYCDYANICGANDIFEAAERKAENVDADTIVKVIKA